MDMTVQELYDELVPFYGSDECEPSVHDLLDLATPVYDVEDVDSILGLVDTITAGSVILDSGYVIAIDDFEVESGFLVVNRNSSVGILKH